MNPPGHTVLCAVWVPRPLAGILAKTARGALLAVFERSAYLDLGGRVLALASESLGRGPLTVSIQGFEALLEAPAPIEAGQPVDLGSGVLRIADRSVDLRLAAVWDPALPREEHTAPARRLPARSAPAHASPGADTRAEVRAAAIEELRRGAPHGSIVPLLDGSPTPQRNRATTLLLDALRRGLEAVTSMLEDPRDPAGAAREAASWIAGRGPGLTPSGDDLLVGIMHAMTVWPSLAAHAWREETRAGDTGGMDTPVTQAGAEPRAMSATAEVRAMLAAAARGYTTRISAPHLDAAAQGWASESWHDLVRSIHSTAAVRNAVRRILRIGETSGADALTGFCWAWGRLAA